MFLNKLLYCSNVAVQLSSPRVNMKADRDMIILTISESVMSADLTKLSNSVQYWEKLKPQQVVILTHTVYTHTLRLVYMFEHDRCLYVKVITIDMLYRQASSHSYITVYTSVALFRPLLSYQSNHFDSYTFSHISYKYTNKFEIETFLQKHTHVDESPHVLLSSLKFQTEYCVQVKIFDGIYGRTSNYSSPQCVYTTGEGMLFSSFAKSFFFNVPIA